MDREDNEDFFEFVDIVENALNNLRAPKRYLRDATNPIEYYSDEEFSRRYRFSKNVVLVVILPLVAERLTKLNNRGLPFSPLLQLLTCLRYYGTGNFQAVSGDLWGISQQTVSKIVKTVSQLIAEHLEQFVEIPRNNDDQQQNSRLFWSIAEFPGVAGCVDCTHVRISSPGGDYAEVFRNRKGYFSLNVQVAVGPHMEIMDIVVRHPGSTHDSVIFDRSALRVQCEQGQLNGILLGDNGYPCRPYLLTPVINPRMLSNIQCLP